MSNDSDFMIYSNIGGFIPFEDVRFVTDENDSTRKRIYALLITCDDVIRITHLQHKMVRHHYLSFNIFSCCLLFHVLSEMIIFC
jgi:hypothetical protein